MRKLSSLVAFLCLLSSVKAQKSDPWTANKQNPKNIITDKAVARQSFPKEFLLYDLDLSSLKRQLISITLPGAARNSTLISLPNADGGIEEFEVFEASNFEPALQERFPEIRAFSGKGITDRYATLKLSISPQGIQTMIFRTDKKNEFIEPYSQDHQVYAVFRSFRKPGALPWTCSTVDTRLATELNEQVSATGRAMSNTGELKTMRLAQSCNGEYANYFGATSAAQVNLVLAAFNATLTRCNGVYERDLALHLNLIASTTSVIYYNPSTDPYTTMSNWNSQLQSTLTSVIGEANYDIGHMFGASGGGGNAGCIGCVCVNGSKGSGITSPSDGIPQGDNFDIDYVAHEVGHQLGANHTFSHSLEGTGVNKEVGSGITIMGYAGITSRDVANHSIEFFHQASIEQIQVNLANKTCPVTTNISANNATPSVAPGSSYTIPISTPFALTGSATDANAGDVLTYSWEQNDNSTTSGANSIASPTKLTGPNWLSFSPTISPTRYFPMLSTILAGNLVTGPLPGGDAGTNIEALSSVSRNLNFRLTVRDNSAYIPSPAKVGQTAYTDVLVTVTNTSGPFTVTQPNTNVSWAAGSTQTITWNVASTTNSPVSCANVKISLSTDGGQSFPYILAASTPNDGSEAVSLPSVQNTTTARIKVEAVGNIFFDISNTNFTLTSSGPDFDFASPPANNITCASQSTSTITLGTTVTGGYNTPINLSATGTPAGTTVSFSINPLTPGSSVNVTLHDVNTLTPGTYNLTITGISGAITKNRVITYVVQPGASPINSHPSNQTVCEGGNATFTVGYTPPVSSFQWQASLNGSNFSDIGASNAAYTITNVPANYNGIQYRVIVASQCSTAVSNPAVLNVNNLPGIPVINPSSSNICVGSIQQLTANSIINREMSFGSQASTNTTTGSAAYPAPYTAWYGAQRMQMLIRSSELTAAGFTPGTNLTSLSFYVLSRGSNWTNNIITSLQSFKISIGHTSLTTLSAFQTGLQEVLPASNFLPVQLWNTHAFTNPFTWNGNNIIIETTWGNNIAGATGDLVVQYYSPATFQSTIVYRADNVSAATAAAATTVNYSYSARPDFRLNGSSISAVSWSPTTSLYTDASATTNYTGQNLSTVYFKQPLPGNYVVTANANNAGCTSQNNTTITVANCTLSLNLKMFFQGLYAGSSTMRTPLYDLGISSDPQASDSISVDLWSTSNLINPSPDHSYKTIFKKDGTAVLSLSGIAEGSAWYIAVRYKNHLETWSAAPVVLTSNTNYDFSNLVTKAYGDGVNPPMINFGGNVFGFYGGDINQDGTVDALDMSVVENDASNFSFGYNISDITGDGATDASDTQVIENNVQLFLFYARPYNQRLIARRLFSQLKR